MQRGRFANSDPAFIFNVQNDGNVYWQRQHAEWERVGGRTYGRASFLFRAIQSDGL